MREEETFLILYQGLYYKEKGFLPDIMQSFSILLFEGNLAGVASDLDLYPPLLASSPKRGAAQCARLESCYHWARITRGRVAVLLCSLLGSPPCLVQVSGLGRPNSGSCLCVDITH